MTAKVYTFEVAVSTGSRQPIGAMRPKADRTVPEWRETITVNVEAESLDAAREAARARGADVADEIVDEWQREYDDTDHHFRSRPNREDATVTARFEDLVVGTSVR